MTTVAPVTTVGPPIQTDDQSLLYTTMAETRDFLYCPSAVRVNDVTVQRVSLVDTGAQICIISRAILPDDFAHRVKTTPWSVRGISGHAEKAEKFYATICVGDSSFENVPLIVMDKPSQDLVLGLPVLRHASVTGFKISWQPEELTFYRVSDGQPVVETVKGHSAISPCVAAGDALTAKSDENMSPERKLAFLRDKIKLKLEWSNASELSKMADLLYEFRHLFDDSSGEFPHHVSIKTRGNPIARNQHVIPLAHQDKVDDEVADMLKRGVIEECPDGKGWRSPLLTVTKDNGKIRVCCNFKRTLNLRLVDEEVFAQKPADELFASIRPGARYFNSMDLKKGYWQLVIREEDRHKTCFQWSGRLYQFCRLPFGLKTAGGLFCRAIGTALNTVDFDRSSTLVYLDDITVLNSDFEKFLAATRKVFEALSKFGLKLGAEKCSFLNKTAKFLGRVLDEKGMRPDPANLSGIMKMRAPTTRKQLQSLIGSLNWLRQFCGEKMYRRVSVESFSHYMYPINACNREGKFLWSNAADLALQKIKEKLTEAPFISFFCPTLPLVLTTDASQYAAGAVLMQKASDDDYRVIGTASRTFTRTEMNWSATEKEAYAIKWGVEKFDYYLASTPFTIMTDHRALTFIDKTVFRNQKVARWQEELSRYSFTVQYLEGRKNVFADWLSRGGEKVEKPKIDASECRPAGTFMEIRRVENDKKVPTGLKVYIPSWVKKNVVNSDRLELTSDERVPLISYARLLPFSQCENISQLCGPSVFLAEKVVETGEEVFRHQTILTRQLADPFYAKIINALKVPEKSSKKKLAMVKEAIGDTDHRAASFQCVAFGLFLDLATGLLCVRSTNMVQLVVPDLMVRELLVSAHDNLAHSGIDRVHGYLAPYYWPGKKADIRNYVRSCVPCTRSKGTYGQRKVKSGINAKGGSMFDTVYLDYISMPAESGYRYCLTLICGFTRYLMVWPLRSNSAKDTSRCLVNFVAQHRIIPRVISSDRGTHFTGQLFKEALSALNIKQNLHVAWRPTSTGVLERQHRTLKNALFITAKERNSPWHQVLPQVVSALNATFNSATKIAPFEAVHGHAGRYGLPSVDQLKAESPGEYALQVNGALRTVHESVRIANRLTDERYLKRVNSGQLRENVQVGDEVCVYRPLSSEANKREPWIGRFTVLETNDLISRIQDKSSKSIEWVSNHHIRRWIERDKKFNFDIDDLDACVSKPTPARPALPKLPLKLPSVKTETRGGGNNGVSVSKSQSKPADASTKTRQKPPVPATELRRGTRNRTQTKHFTTETTRGGKSYATVVRSGPISAPLNN